MNKGIRVFSFCIAIILFAANTYVGLVFADPPTENPGQGNCTEGFVHKDESSPFSFETDSSICSVEVKAGSDQSTDDNACTRLASDGSNGCYTVSGLGSGSVSVEKVGTGSDCKDISHVEFYPCSQDAPTPTATATTTSTPSSTPIATYTPSATPTVSDTPSDTPTVTPEVTSNPTATPVPTPTIPNFPSCPLPGDGDLAHYDYGLHQIVAGPLLPGSDDVYTIGEGIFVQCFCGVDGNGIQTNWFRTENVPDGWYTENGRQWNLGDYQYAAQNSEYACVYGTPTPTAPETTGTPNPSPTPTNGGGTGGWSPGSHGGGGSPYVCTDEKPGTPVVTDVSRTSTTTVDITWDPAEKATDYTIVYGTEPGHYIFGVSSTGNVTKFTIGDLDPKEDYFFAVAAINGCMPGDFSTMATYGDVLGTGGAEVLGATTLAATGHADERIAWYAIVAGTILVAASIYGTKPETASA